MRGKIVDANGEPLPGATVIAIHTPTGSEYGNVTDLDGNFRIPNMSVGGPYKVTVSFVGFENNEKNNIYLDLGQTFSLNLTLTEGVTQLSEVVVVASESDIFDGNRTGAQTTVSDKDIQNLPTASRNLVDYLRLTPQANQTETDDGPAISIAGQNNRFNSIFIDGAVNNDVFGLSGSGTNGGQSGVGPISPDAIQQFQVVVSPFDVSLGNFTGGGINAVTRSGSNKFEGSAYWFNRNENFAGKTPTDNEEANRVRFSDQSSNTYGFRLGGPLIKNKLFFFVNAELQRDEESQPLVFEDYQGSATEADLDGLRNFLINTHNYDPGDFRNNIRQREGDKVLVKLDWNANKNHKFSFRHSFSRAEEIEANASNSGIINFFNNAETFPSVTNSSAFEWRANFGNTASNKLIIGYTNVRDDRGVTGNPFPNVTIEDGRFNSIRFGSEQFSVGNILNQDVLTLTNNFNLFKGNHTITIGTHNEFYSFFNLFIRQNFGSYVFGSLDDFTQGLGAIEYERSYALLPGVDSQQGDNATGIAADFSAIQLGFYVQDEWQINSKLKLTGGLRLDIPTYLTDPETNEDFNNNSLPLFEQFYDLRGARSGSIPDASFLVSPRLGFNYDVFDDRSLQVRGGLGIFTGRTPIVWPGGSYTNNGVFLASVEYEFDPDSNVPVIANRLPFRANPNDQYIGSEIGATGNPSQVDLFAEDFNFPQVFRTSLAADYKLNSDWIVNVEGIYTKNINSVIYQNINVRPAPFVVNEPFTPFQRPVYDGQAIDPSVDRVLLGFNTNKGFSYNLTAGIKRPFKNGWTAGASYTFGRSKTLNDLSSSQNSSNWANLEAVDRNNLTLGFSDFDLGSRVNAYVSYRLDYAGQSATTISLFYNGQSGDRVSYVYGRTSFRNRSILPGGGFTRAIGGDDLAGRDFNHLIYIPRNASEINLIDFTDDDGNVVTAAQQWESLNSFIEDDNYLSNNRGEFADANAGRLPVEHILDFKIQQEFYIKVGENKNTLQVSFDVFNFTNLLNRNWGRRRFINFSTADLINFEGFVDSQNGDFTPQYTFEDNRTLQERASIDDSGIYSSRWQAQLGVRYIFGN